MSVQEDQEKLQHGDGYKLQGLRNGENQGQGISPPRKDFPEEAEHDEECMQG